MNGELTWEELMHFVLGRGLEWTFTTRESGKDGNLRLPFGSQEAEEAGHWLDFHGKAGCSLLACSQAWQLGAGGRGAGARPASSHGLLGTHKGRCKTELWIGTVALCLEADWLLRRFVKASPFPVDEVCAVRRAVFKSWFSDSRWRDLLSGKTRWGPWAANDTAEQGPESRPQRGSWRAWNSRCREAHFHLPKGWIALRDFLNLNTNKVGYLYFVSNTN